MKINFPPKLKKLDIKFQFESHINQFRNLPSNNEFKELRITNLDFNNVDEEWLSGLQGGRYPAVDLLVLIETRN